MIVRCPHRGEKCRCEENVIVHGALYCVKSSGKICKVVEEIPGVVYMGEREQSKGCLF